MIKKTILYSLLAIILLIISFLLVPYLISPIYNFSEPKQFSGQGYYNPYQQMVSAWQVSNFHAHSKSWGGLTDGKNTHIDSIFKVYQKMGYSHIGISNYQGITPLKAVRHCGLDPQSPCCLQGIPAFAGMTGKWQGIPHQVRNDELPFISIPTYEHGFNIKKRHHLCLGTDKVSWLDFFFCQTLSHKQFVLNNLKPTADFLTIAHPKFSNSFDETDFTYLSNYDAIEVLNHYRTSVTHWDSALSSGYYAVLLANDDMHKLDKMDEIGANFTVINTNSLTRYAMIQALKVGRHYGVQARLKPDENYAVKTERIANLVRPYKIEMKGDTLVLQLNTDVFVVRFVGQGGRVKDSVTQTKSAQYVFCQTDTYIRIEIEDTDGNLYLFNPIVRTDSQFVINPIRAEINICKTTFKRIFIVSVLFLTAFGIYWIRCRFGIHQQNSNKVENFLEK